MNDYIEYYCSLTLAVRMFHSNVNPWHINFMSPPCPWGEGGHLDLLWFPVTQMCVGVHVCARLCLRSISYGDFQMLRYGDHGQGLELIKCPLLNFQVHRSSCFKINFVYAIFCLVLC